MKAKIIFYKQMDILPKERTKFKKELSGHNDSSHGGRYKYKINGVLDEIQFIKPCHGAIIIKSKDSIKIIKLIEKYKIEHRDYEIIVQESEFNK